MTTTTETAPADTAPVGTDDKASITVPMPKWQKRGFQEAARRSGFLSVTEFIRTSAWAKASEVLNAPDPSAVHEESGK